MNMKATEDTEFTEKGLKININSPNNRSKRLVSSLSYQ